jgi:hypothetical protein
MNALSPCPTDLALDTGLDNFVPGVYRLARRSARVSKQGIFFRSYPLFRTAVRFGMQKLRQKLQRILHLAEKLTHRKQHWRVQSDQSAGFCDRQFKKDLTAA